MTSRRDFLLGSAALVTSAYAGAQDASKSKPRSLLSIQDDLRELISASMLRDNVPGVSLALVREHEIVWAEAFGVRDLELHDDLTPETVFEAASFSKPAFGYAVLELVDQGKLSLEKSLVEYLGRDPLPDEPRFKQITAAHVLSHTSGIDPGSLKLVSTPGERFRYSPQAFSVLQKTVEHVTGETLVPLMRRTVLEPFGMKRSAFDWSEEFAKSGARGYDARGNHQETANESVWRMPKDERTKFDAQYPWKCFPNAAASLHSTPSDYARFLIEVMHPSREDARLSTKMRDEMLTPHVQVEGIASKDLFWGYGFALQRPPSEPASFGHTGDWGGNFQHYSVAYRDEGSALVMMTNGPGANVCREAVALVFGRQQPTFQWWLGG